MFSEKYFISKDFKPIQLSENEKEAIPITPNTVAKIFWEEKVEAIQMAKAISANEYGKSNGPSGFFEFKIILNMYKEPKMKSSDTIIVKIRESFAEILANQVM